MNGPLKVWLGWVEGSKQCPETYSSPLTDSKSSQGLLRPPEAPRGPRDTFPSPAGRLSTLVGDYTTYYTLPPRSLALPCWGSSASRRPGTESAGMRDPT